MELGYLGFSGGSAYGGAYGAVGDDGAIKALTTKIDSLSARIKALVAQRNATTNSIVKKTLTAQISPLTQARTAAFNKRAQLIASRKQQLAKQVYRPPPPMKWPKGGQQGGGSKGGGAKTKNTLPEPAAVEAVPEAAPDSNKKWWIIGGVIAAIAGVGGAFALGRRGGAKPAPKSAFAAGA